MRHPVFKYWVHNNWNAVSRPVFLFVAVGEVVAFAHGADSGQMRQAIKWARPDDDYDYDHDHEDHDHDNDDD